MFVIHRNLLFLAIRKKIIELYVQFKAVFTVIISVQASVQHHEQSWQGTIANQAEATRLTPNVIIVITLMPQPIGHPLRDVYHTQKHKLTD